MIPTTIFLLSWAYTEANKCYFHEYILHSMMYFNIQSIVYCPYRLFWFWWIISQKRMIVFCMTACFLWLMIQKIISNILSSLNFRHLMFVLKLHLLPKIVSLVKLFQVIKKCKKSLNINTELFLIRSDKKSYLYNINAYKKEKYILSYGFYIQKIFSHMLCTKWNWKVESAR